MIKIIAPQPIEWVAGFCALCGMRASLRLPDASIGIRVDLLTAVKKQFSPRHSQNRACGASPCCCAANFAHDRALTSSAASLRLPDASIGIRVDLLTAELFLATCTKWVILSRHGKNYQNNLKKLSTSKIMILSEKSSYSPSYSRYPQILLQNLRFT